ncbi:MAG: hypothetical protein IKX50_03115 [Spirochaetia bacterium]|nr:hypothetical protein [Spirochaetia bacterium]
MSYKMLVPKYIPEVRLALTSIDYKSIDLLLIHSITAVCIFCQINFT